MVDREKVTKGLKCHKNAFCEDENGNVCPYWQDISCSKTLSADALELLKEHEPVRVGKKIKAGDVVLDFYQCGHCKNAIRQPWRYCPFCGKAVKWDE